MREKEREREREREKAKEREREGKKIWREKERRGKKGIKAFTPKKTQLICPFSHFYQLVKTRGFIVFEGCLSAKEPYSSN